MPQVRRYTPRGLVQAYRDQRGLSLHRRCSVDDLLDAIWIDENDRQPLARVANQGRAGERGLSVNEDRALWVAAVAFKGSPEALEGQIRAHRYSATSSRSGRLAAPNSKPTTTRPPKATPSFLRVCELVAY